MEKQESATDENIEEDDLRPEYDFGSLTGGIRGKYYQAYRQGHTVRIHKTDGTVVEQHFMLEDGAEMLDPDVREYFPDSEAVNQALRGLITLMPEKRKAPTAARRRAAAQE